MKYAAQTSVSCESSKAEIERTVRKYGATGFASGWKGDTIAVIQFEMGGRRILFRLTMPDKAEFACTPIRQTQRSARDQLAAWEQGCRQSWRALALVIKAKLEAVETGITVFEEEFLAHIVLPNGGTVGEFILPQIAVVYKTGRMPALLPGLESERPQPLMLETKKGTG